MSNCYLSVRIGIPLGHSYSAKWAMFVLVYISKVCTTLREWIRNGIVFDETNMTNYIFRNRFAHSSIERLLFSTANVNKADLEQV